MRKKTNLPREHIPLPCGIQGLPCLPEPVLTHPWILLKPFLGRHSLPSASRTAWQTLLLLSLSQLLSFSYSVLVEVLKTCYVSWPLPYRKTVLTLWRRTESPECHAGKWSWLPEESQDWFSCTLKTHSPFFFFPFIKKAVQCLERADIHPIPSLALWVGEFSRLGKICANAKEFYKINVSVQLIQFLIPSKQGCE